MTQHEPRFLPDPNSVSEQTTPPGRPEFRTLLLTLWRGKMIISAASVGAVVLTTYYVLAVATALYTSSVVVIFDTRQTSVLALPSVIAAVSGEPSSVTSEVEVLRARTLMTDVAPMCLTWNAIFERRWRIRSRRLKMMIRATPSRRSAFSEYCSEPSIASSSGMVDITARQWSETLADLAGLRSDQLPRVYNPGTQVGVVSARAADETGLTAVAFVHRYGGVLNGRVSA